MTGGAERVGVLGGTFDPIHNGHLAAAQAACDALSLDRVLLVPSHHPPHRSRDPHASSFHRFAMVSLAVAGRPNLVASDIELRKAGPSFTSATLRGFHKAGLGASQIFFIIGTDAFAEIAMWHEYPTVLDLANFVVIARDGCTMEQMQTRVPELADRFRDASVAPPEGGHRTAIHLVRTHTPAVSSTVIRAELAAGRSVADFVGADVDRHIRKHRLYAHGATAL